jgi:hypothetical protein
MLPDGDRFLKVCQFPVRHSDAIDLYLLFRSLSVTTAMYDQYASRIQRSKHRQGLIFFPDGVPS